MHKRHKAKHGLRIGFVLFLLLSVILLVFLTTNLHFKFDPRSFGESSDQYITRNGTKFYLGTQEFRFVGFNLFDSAGATGPYSCLATNGWFAKFTESELDQAMKDMKSQAGATVLRFWAFQKYTKGATDFSGIDTVIRLAKANGLKVIPVLDDGQGYCTEPGGGGNNHLAKWQYQSDTWYKDGYKVINSGNTLSYKDYVSRIVERYKNEPTIFAWMMMNEADTSCKDTAVTGDCKDKPGPSILVKFAQDIGSLIKSIDTNHLVTVGTQSNGASGATGQDFLNVYGLSVIDFSEAHDWGYWGDDTLAIPGGSQKPDGTWSLPDPASPECLKTYQAKIGCSIAQSIQTLKKPIIIGEAGIAATDDQSRSRRAQLIDAKMKAFFANGGAGYIYWQWNHIVDSEHYDVLVTTNDPLLPVMKKYAGITISPAVTPIATKTPTSVPQTSSPTFVPTKRPTPTPILFPTVTPKPSATPRPTPIPTKTPTPLGSTIEGESLVTVTGLASVSDDVNATNNKALFIMKNGTYRGQFQGSVKSLTVRARAHTCLGYPHINVLIDGNYVLDQNIYATSYTDYKTNSLSYMNLGSSLHTIEVVYNNDATFGFCDRNVFIDKITSE